MKTVGVMGLGKLGLSTAAVLSTGNKVIGYDPIVTEIPTVFPEPGVLELLKKTGNFKLGTPKEIADHADAIFIIVPTPSLDSGAFDNTHVYTAMSEVVMLLSTHRDTVINIVSTVMPGSNTAFKDHLLRCRPVLQEHCTVTYNPEFIALGSIVRDLINPDLVLIGADEKDSYQVISEIWRDTFDACDVLGAECRWLTPIDVEVAKLSLNMALNTKIALANYIADVARNCGCSCPQEILSAIGADSRIGAQFFKEGWAPGGPCLPRDLRAFDFVCKSQGIKSPSLSEFLDGCNNARRDAIVHSVLASPRAPKVHVLIIGIGYTKNAYIVTESGPKDLYIALRLNGYDVKVWDPILEPDDLDAKVAWANCIVMSYDYDIDLNCKPNTKIWRI